MPHGINSLFQNFPDYEQRDQAIAVCGEYTKKMAEERNLKISVYAPTKEFPSLVNALDDFFLKSVNKIDNNKQITMKLSIDEANISQNKNSK